jgi:hypothetical protein
MSAAVMAPIEVDGIRGEKPAHQVSKPGLPRAQQKVKMVGHQRPRKALSLSFCEKIGEPAKKFPPVIVIKKQLAAIHSTSDDVIGKTWDVQTCSSRHATYVAWNNELGNR